MLEQVKYRNHLGEEVTFGKGGIFVNENDLRDFAWSYTAKNNRISSFQKGVVKKTLPVILACTSEGEGIIKRNNLFEVCEKDVLAHQHGKFIIGDYYLKCYIVGSKKSDYLMNNRVLKLKLSVVTDSPAWVKESVNIFRRLDSVIVDENAGSNLDFPHDFPFDFASEVTNRDIINDDFVSTNFRMTIYGPCTNPEIYVGGHCYAVNTELLANEHLIVDSAAKTITLYHTNGDQVNCFNNRSREHYVFEKIPSGANAVTWEGNFGFDITLLEERSEPKWT